MEESLAGFSMGVPEAIPVTILQESWEGSIVCLVAVL